MKQRSYFLFKGDCMSRANTHDKYKLITTGWQASKGKKLQALCGDLWDADLSNCWQECSENCFFLSVWHLGSSELMGFLINHLDHNSCMDRGLKRADLSCHFGLCEEHCSFFFLSFLPFLQAISSINQTTPWLRPKTKKHIRWHLVKWLDTAKSMRNRGKLHLGLDKQPTSQTFV